MIITMDLVILTMEKWNHSHNFLFDNFVLTFDVYNHCLWGKNPPPPHFSGKTLVSSGKEIETKRKCHDSGEMKFQVALAD